MKLNIYVWQVGSWIWWVVIIIIIVNDDHNKKKNVEWFKVWMRWRSLRESADRMHIAWGDLSETCLVCVCFLDYYRLWLPHLINCPMLVVIFCGLVLFFHNLKLHFHVCTSFISHRFTSSAKSMQSLLSLSSNLNMQIKVSP